jgi:uncharacterized repeat protein (TIGR03803 family)
LISDASGNLYGTTHGGFGNGGLGTVFEVVAGTHALSTLVTFDNINGAYPTASLLADGSGNLYGTTDAGGANNLGTVFEVATGTRAFSTLAAFNGMSGSNASNLIIDAAGNLYGTARNDGANLDGTVFEVVAGTHTLRTLATFNGTNGSYPSAGLFADDNGNLYGTTDGGGANGQGTVFKLSLLRGDFDDNGVVDTSDYTVWRDTLGSADDLRADGNGDGTIDAGDYELWKANFSRRNGSGANSNAAVPEPATLWLLNFGILAMCSHRLIKSRKLINA